MKENGAQRNKTTYMITVQMIEYQEKLNSFFSPKVILPCYTAPYLTRDNLPY